MDLREILDDGREGETLTMSRRSRVIRMLLCAMIGGLLAYNFGWKAAALWIGVNLVLEACLAALNAWFRLSENGRTFWVIRLCLGVAFAAVWSTMAALCWIHGQPAMKFAALIILFGLLIEGLKYSSVSKSAMLALVPPPMIALAVAATGYGGFGRWAR